MRNKVRNALIFVVLSLVFTSCDRRDAQLRQQIAGTWYLSSGVIRGVIVFVSDGSASSHLTNGTEELAFQMTWKVKDGIIISTDTRASARNTTNWIAVGDVTRSEVIHVDDHQLVYSSNGRTISLSRQK
jgi:predicted RNA-binding protein with PUA domain